MSIPRPVSVAASAVCLSVLLGGPVATAADDAKPPLTVRNDGSRALTNTTDGVRWSLKGARLSVTIARSAAKSVRRRTLGRILVIACGAEGRTVAELASTHTTARFPRATGRTVRAVLPKHLRRVTACVLEQRGRPDDLVAVRFAPKQPAQVLPADR